MKIGARTFQMWWSWIWISVEIYYFSFCENKSNLHSKILQLRCLIVTAGWSIWWFWSSLFQYWGEEILCDEKEFWQISRHKARALGEYNIIYCTENRENLCVIRFGAPAMRRDWNIVTNILREKFLNTFMTCTYLQHLAPCF